MLFTTWMLEQSSFVIDDRLDFQSIELSIMFSHGTRNGDKLGFEQVDGWMGGWVDGCTGGQADGRVDGWMGRWADGWTGGWTGR